MKIGLLNKMYLCCMTLLLLFLTGCCRTPSDGSSAPYRVVTEVQVLYENGTMQTQKQFFAEKSIRHIIEYLRYIDPYGLPHEDPEQVVGRDYHITLIYSDGSRHNYHQRADRFLRVDGGPWKRIDPQKALILSGLYGMMPGEDAPIDDAPILPLIKPQI